MDVASALIWAEKLLVRVWSGSTGTLFGMQIYVLLIFLILGQEKKMRFWIKRGSVSTEDLRNPNEPDPLVLCVTLKLLLVAGSNLYLSERNATNQVSFNRCSWFWFLSAIFIWVFQLLSVQCERNLEPRSGWCRGPAAGPQKHLQT